MTRLRLWHTLFCVCVCVRERTAHLMLHAALIAPWINHTHNPAVVSALLAAAALTAVINTLICVVGRCAFCLGVRAVSLYEEARGRVFR